MSLILDALKRKKPAGYGYDGDEGDFADEARADAHSDAVLSSLALPRPRREQGLSVKMLLVYGAAAMAIGFVGLSLLIVLFAPPERPQPAPTMASARASSAKSASSPS